MSELIKQLRAELSKAQGAEPGSPLRFGVGPIEVETTLSVTRATKGNVGLVLKVLSLGAERSVGEGSTARLKLTLTPTDARDPHGRLTVFAHDAGGDPAPRREGGT